jgi:hypothetical protein
LHIAIAVVAAAVAISCSLVVIPEGDLLLPLPLPVFSPPSQNLVILTEPSVNDLSSRDSGKLLKTASLSLPNNYIQFTSIEIGGNYIVHAGIELRPKGPYLKYLQSIL